jgi:hypothetical protein
MAFRGALVDFEAALGILKRLKQFSVFAFKQRAHLVNGSDAAKTLHFTLH